MKIRLNELADALAQSDVRQAYVDIAHGKVVVMQEDMNEEEALDHVFDIEEDWEHYIPLPNLIDGEEHAVMQKFAQMQRRDDIKERLLAILSGSGAASRFQREVRHLLLKPAWENFLKAYLVEAARDWCEENALQYEE